MSKNNFNGKLYINIDNLLDNIERFNAEYEVHFSSSTTIEEVQDFFKNEYISLYNESMPNQFTASERFNDLFMPFAYMMK